MSAEPEYTTFYLRGGKHVKALGHVVHVEQGTWNEADQFWNAVVTMSSGGRFETVWSYEDKSLPWWREATGFMEDGLKNKGTNTPDRTIELLESILDAVKEIDYNTTKR